MRMLLPIGVVLIVIGLGGSAAACFGTSLFNDDEAQTVAAKLDGPTDSVASATEDARESSAPTAAGPLAGLTAVIGFVCVVIGANNWRRDTTGAPGQP